MESLLGINYTRLLTLLSIRVAIRVLVKPVIFCQQRKVLPKYERFGDTCPCSPTINLVYLSNSSS